jgi:hypothetical protein
MEQVRKIVVSIQFDWKKYALSYGVKSASKNSIQTVIGG